MSGIGDNGGPPLDSATPSPFDREGWVAIARTLRGHWLVGFGKAVEPGDPERGFVYSKGEAWQDLIMECRYVEGTVNNNGQRMKLAPGQLLGATSWLAHRWNWSPKTVRGFLDKLEAEGMITRQNPETIPRAEQTSTVSNSGRSKGRFANVLTVSKYSLYQLAHRHAGQVGGQVEGRLRAGRGPVEGHIYKDEQGNKGTAEQEKFSLSEPSSDDAGDKLPAKKRAAYPEAFEAFWKAYPVTTNNSKSRAFEEWSRFSERDRAAAASSLDHYRAYCRAHPNYTCLHAERYLKYRRFEAHVGGESRNDRIGRMPDYWYRGKEDAARSMSDETWRSIIGDCANGIWPIEKLGPPPGSPGCFVPAHITAELSLLEKYGPARTGGTQ